MIYVFVEEWFFNKISINFGDISVNDNNSDSNLCDGELELKKFEDIFV